jgi:hypothetical protein
MAKMSTARRRTVVRTITIDAELGAALSKALEHVDSAQKEAARLPDRSTDGAGHSCVCAMHAHCKAANQYLDQHALLSEDAERLATPVPVYGSLSKALDCIKGAAEEADTLPNPEADAAQHAECVRSIHGQIKIADGCLDRYRSVAADNDDIGDTAPSDAEARRARERARATAAVVTQALH